jgi:hypothetical protein
MSEAIDIKGIDKAELLAALYNNSRPMGSGFLQAIPGDMTVEQARKEIESGDDSSRMFGKNRCGNRELYFDYLRGRPLKSDISGDTFDPWGYDRDNGGKGAAARIVEALRAKQKAA